MEKNVNCNRQPSCRATEEVEQGGKDGLDMQDGRKNPQTAMVKNLLEATRVQEKTFRYSYGYDDT
jgi:hypothetical protein